MGYKEFKLDKLMRESRWRPGKFVAPMRLAGRIKQRHSNLGLYFRFKMPFKKFVETGRIAYITKGRYGRRLCTIVDVVDQNRALIDGPCTGVPRMAIKLKQLRLTKFLIKFPFRASTKVVRKVWSESDIKDKWANSVWAKNLQKRRLRRQLTDFDRFKLRHAKKIRNKMRTKEYIKMYLADKKQRGKLKFENRGKKGYNRRERKPRVAKPAAKSVAKPPPKK